MMIEPRFAIRDRTLEGDKTQFPGTCSAISGHRYYNPALGRFLGRDQIEEKGGLNLYAFCTNNGANSWDLLGDAGFWETIANWLGWSDPTGTPDPNNSNNQSGSGQHSSLVANGDGTYTATDINKDINGNYVTNTYVTGPPSAKPTNATSAGPAGAANFGDRVAAAGLG